MSRTKKILIAENRPTQLRAMKELFELDGEWQVLTADEPEAAREVLTDGWVHLAIIDLRLVNDDDINDLSGLELIRNTDPIIPKIIWTAYPTFGVLKEALADVGGVRPAVGFVDDQDKNIDMADKASEFDEFLKQIDDQFRHSVRINLEMIIEPAPGASLHNLVTQITSYRESSPAQLDTLAEELEDVLRKLFLTADRLRLEYMSPGDGGSGVVQAQSVDVGVQGGHVIVKFGQRDSVRHEVGNYIRYVRPFAGQYSTALEGEMAETLHFGAARFSLIGQKGEARSFNSFCCHESAKKAQKVLKFLFETICDRWYAGKRGWSDPELDHRPERFGTEGLRDRPDALALALEMQKGFYPLIELREELMKAVAGAPSTPEIGMFSGEAFHGSQFRLIGGAEFVESPEFEVTISDPPEKTLRLPNPLHYVETHRAGWKPPRFWALTHGNLDGCNILVDDEGHAWLIDFYKTGWGPALRDFAQLEAVIRIQLTETRTTNLLALSELEEGCLKLRRFDQVIDFSNAFNLDSLRKAAQLVTFVRQQAMKVAETLDMREYYICLLYHTLKLVTSGSVSKEVDADSELRRRHALISAGLICKNLQDWLEMGDQGGGVAG